MKNQNQKKFQIPTVKLEFGILYLRFLTTKHRRNLHK